MHNVNRVSNSCKISLKGMIFWRDLTYLGLFFMHIFVKGCFVLFCFVFDF